MVVANQETIATLLRKKTAEEAYNYICASVPKQEDKQLAAEFNAVAQQLFMAGHTSPAISLLMRLLRAMPEQVSFKNNIGFCIAHGVFSEPDSNVRTAIIDALKETWAPERELVRGAISYLKLDHAQLFFQMGQQGVDLFARFIGDPLTLAALGYVLPDRDIEWLLTEIRKRYLNLVAHSGSLSAPDRLFLARLGCHCFVNEFIYDVDEDEAALLSSLTGPSVDRLLIAACYGPLPDSPESGDSLFKDILEFQIRQPRMEIALGADIPRLTTISDEVSRKVQEHYEEHPYPRWERLPVSIRQTTVPAEMARRFPGATISLPENARILIAGCGTGQQSLYLARQFPKSQILAIDFSAASLRYALRKTKEAGIGNIEYAQADILELDKGLGPFDYIVCAGVLHHMRDPNAGLMRLLDLLSNRGVIELGLYSEAARKCVVAAKELILENGFSTEIEAIRRCRRTILALPEFHPARACASSADFYSASGCRDLIFHHQETRYDLPRVRTMIAEAGCELVGFSPSPKVASLYLSRHPTDKRMAIIDNWERLEQEIPTLFSEMYHFVLQKKRSEPEQPFRLFSPISASFGQGY